MYVTDSPLNVKYYINDSFDFPNNSIRGINDFIAN